jgi:hypothetical protein
MILQLLALKDFFGLVTVTDGLHNSVSGFEKKKLLIHRGIDEALSQYAACNEASYAKEKEQKTQKKGRIYLIFIRFLFIVVHWR